LLSQTVAPTKRKEKKKKNKKKEKNQKKKEIKEKEKKPIPLKGDRYIIYSLLRERYNINIYILSRAHAHARVAKTVPARCEARAGFAPL
jgi:hypothetical protein